MGVAASWFFRNTTIPLWMYRDDGLRALSVLKEFRRLKELSLADLSARQSHRLTAMLRYTVTTVPYYRELFNDLRIDVVDVSRHLDLRSIPLLTKKIVRQNQESLVSEAIPADQRYRDSTGGSTGMPMTFFRSRGCLTLRRAQDLFFDEWFSCRLGDKVALFVSASHHDGVSRSFKAWLRKTTFERILRFDPSQTSDAEIAQFLPLYTSFSPEIIKCFPNSLAIFSDYLRRKDIDVRAVRTIFCTGESLYAHQRNEFRRLYGGQVVERYGTKECGLIASECPAGDGLHLFTEGVYVEVVGEDGNPVPPGGSGRILVTDLFNDAMPLIRYEIGDRAQTLSTNAPCRCGSSLPRIARILGRDRDIVISADGVKRPGYLFVECIARNDIDAQVQVVQIETGDLEVRICGYNGPHAPLERMRRELADLIGPGFNVTIKFVEEIPRDPSGKFPYVVSRLSGRPSSAM